jgi:hypothetical protein
MVGITLRAPADVLEVTKCEEVQWMFWMKEKEAQWTQLQMLEVRYDKIKFHNN